MVVQAEAATAPGAPQWWAICLCAQWCAVCRDFRATVDALSAERPDVRAAWVDVEDDEQLVGDLDIETFPTMLVARDDEVLFFGPILPQAGVLARLLDGLRSDGATRVADAPAQQLLERVRADLNSGA